MILLSSIFFHYICQCIHLYVSNKLWYDRFVGKKNCISKLRENISFFWVKYFQSPLYIHVWCLSTHIFFLDTPYYLHYQRIEYQYSGIYVTLIDKKKYIYFFTAMEEAKKQKKKNSIFMLKHSNFHMTCRFLFIHEVCSHILLRGILSCLFCILSSMLFYILKFS